MKSLSETSAYEAGISKRFHAGYGTVKTYHTPVRTLPSSGAIKASLSDIMQPAANTVFSAKLQLADDGLVGKSPMG